MRESLESPPVRTCETGIHETECRQIREGVMWMAHSTAFDAVCVIDYFYAAIKIVNEAVAQEACQKIMWAGYEV
jgi:hypothetical protein